MAKGNKTKKINLEPTDEIKTPSIEDNTNMLGIGIIFVTLIIIVCTGIYLYVDSIKNSSDSTNTTDAFIFKNEYESLNNKKDSEGNNYKSLSISKQNSINYASYSDIIEILDSKTGLIYFGSSSDKMCREIIPILLTASKEVNLKEIYYYDPTSIRDVKELDINGNIIIKKIRD